MVLHPDVARSEFLVSLLSEKGSLEAADVAMAATHGDAASVELITTAGRVVVGVIGAAAMVTDELFGPSRLVHWLAAGAPNSDAHAIAAAE